MSDDRNADGTEPSEEQNEARRLAVEAARNYIESFEGYEGSVVTGYVLIMETQKLGDVPTVTWMTGNGIAPEGEAYEGLATHRVVGLVENVRLTLQARKIVEFLEREDR